MAIELLTKAIFDRLSSYAPLIADLPLYGGLPAIFSGGIVPADAPYPRVLIELPTASGHDDNVDNQGRDIVRDIYIYAARGSTTASANPAERIAENVHRALHQYDVGLDGWDFISANAGGPDGAPTEEALIGLFVSVVYKFHESD